MLLRKQETFSDEFCVELDFKPQRRGYEAGVTIWWNMYSYASIGITAVERDGKLVQTIVCRTPTSTAGKIKAMFPLIQGETSSGTASTFNDSSPVTISAKASPTTYTLVLSQREVISKVTFNADQLTVNPLAGAAFTGVMFGIYSFGDWEPVLDPADFSNILIREHGP